MNKIKKAFLWSSFFFLCLFLIFDKNGGLGNKKILSMSIMDLDAVKEVTSQMAEISPNQVILYNDSPVVLEESTNTIYIPQNIYQEQWSGKISAEEGKMGIGEDELLKEKKRAIEEGHVFKLYWFDDESFCEYNLVFTGMPIVSLKGEKEGAVWTGTAEVFDSYRTSVEYQKFDCTFHVRGGSSREFSKKGYKVELTEKQGSLLGMRKDDDWILNALYDDAGLIHNMVSMKVWDKITEYNSVKGDSGFKGEYAEVFINGEYEGVYIISERVDEKELSLKQNDKLYKCRAVRIPEEHNYTNQDTDDMRPIFLLKYPKEDISENWQPLKEWVNCFLKLQVFDYAEAEKLLNMENAIDYNLFCLLIGGGDNMRKNVFFTAEYQADGQYRFIKNPWDLNATWGNPWVGIEESNNTLYDPEYYKNVIDWSGDISALYYMDEVKVSYLLYERWKELRQNQVITEEIIDNILNVQFSYLHNSGAYERNYVKWPHGVEYWSDSYIYEYVENRIKFLDVYFEQLYSNNINGIIYNGVDYSDEFEARFYWESNYEVLSEIYDYDPVILLEHYIQYGKPYGVPGRPDDVSQIPVQGK